MRGRLAPGTASPDGAIDDPLGYAAHWAPADEAQARDAIAPAADAEAFDRSGREEAERIVGRLERPADADVLDLGCGIGRVARHVAPAVRTLLAADASAMMLALARTRLADLANVGFVRAASASLPAVASSSVDLAYSILVLQHVEREDAVLMLRDVVRVLRPGGIAILTYPNLLSDPYLDAFLGYVDRREVANSARARFYTPQEVERIVPTTGLVIDSIEADVEIRVTAHRPT